MVPFNLGLDPDNWMEERIRLFFDYCYPSVRHQSQKNFRWLVFFDNRTPKEFLDRISSSDSARIIEFKFTDHWDKMDGEILKILEGSKKKSNLIISTRLDCDDALSYKFIQILQQKVSQLGISTPYALNCTYGIILDINSGVFHQKKMISNPFISMVQEFEHLDKSIFGLQHQVISDQIITHEIVEPKMWLQVVHGGNLLNKTSGFPLVNNLTREFNIKDPIFGGKIKPLVLVSEYIRYIKVRFNNAKYKIKKALGQ